MIYPDDAKDFSTLMDVTWQSIGRNTVDKKTKQYWFNKLQKHPLGNVAEAFDKWLLTSKELPTIPDIIKLTIVKDDVYQLEKAPLSQDENKQWAANVVQHVAKNLKPKTDYHAWFKRILRNPQNFPLTSVSEAKRAALEFGYDLATLIKGNT